MIEIVECLNEQGRSPYQDWFFSLDSQAAALVTVAIERLADGNTSRVKGIGEGAQEVRIDRGPGYRVYFGWDGKTLVVLLGGGTKRRQQRDIAAALALWRAYKARKVTVRRK
ncbi:MAG TPA: type II toxin-antitoxin system RelE/ParE family toxin [Xanthobacteraceae bacterium]|nr:type II toxin-antitoxin system RelE/ParE family toxin [Xanthobacteraceae bacterium]